MKILLILTTLLLSSNALATNAYKHTFHENFMKEQRRKAYEHDRDVQNQAREQFGRDYGYRGY